MTKPLCEPKTHREIQSPRDMGSYWDIGKKHKQKQGDEQKFWERELQ